MIITIVELSQNRKTSAIKVIWIWNMCLIFSYRIYFKNFWLINFWKTTRTEELWCRYLSSRLTFSI